MEMSEFYDGYGLVAVVVHEHEALVAVSAAARLDEAQRSLQRVLAPGRAVEGLALLQHAAYEEHAVVVARHGEARQIVHHRVLELGPVPALEVGRPRGIRVVIEVRGHVSVIPAEAVEEVVGIHQPLGVAEERHLQLGVRARECVEHVEHGAQLGRARRVEHHYVGLHRAERPGEAAAALAYVRHAAGHSALLQPAAQAEGEHALVARLVVAVHHHHVVVPEAVGEVVGRPAVEVPGRLVHLEHVRVCVNVVARDGERNDQPYAVVLGEERQRTGLLRVQRTEDYVAVGHALLHQRAVDVGVYGHVPRAHGHRASLPLQVLAGHEQSAVILGHAPPVAVGVVQRQQHAHLQRPRLGGPRGLAAGAVGLGGRGLPLGVWDEDVVALPKLVARLPHVRVGLGQLVHGQPVPARYAVERLLGLHLVHLAPLSRLGRAPGRGQEEGARQQYAS